jgi:hypothetical protein
VTGQQVAVAGKDSWWRQISLSYQNADFFKEDFGCATKKKVATYITRYHQDLKREKGLSMSPF